MLKKYINRETISYLIFGVMTTMVDYVVYIVLTKMLGMEYLTAQNIAWSAAVLFAFVTNKIFVFQSMEFRFLALLKEFVNFVLARLASGIFNFFGLKFLVEIQKMNDLAAKVLLSVMVIVMNYFFSKWFIFKKKTDV